ncbi:MAG: alanine racemase [Clostridia bacterium]|nr:alanine racemase [Clostridia bacterium]
MKDERTARSWREINLNAIEHNIKEVQKHIKPHTMIMGVVKANAYEHGIVEVSKTMLASGVSMLAVAEINEAEALRNAGISAPILILGPNHLSTIPKAVELSVTTSVVDIEFAKELSVCASEKGVTAKIHIKIDSGMTRVGFNMTDDALSDILKISKLPNIYIEGIFSHFACADEKDESVTRKQFESFMAFADRLSENGIEIPIKHISNSAAILRFPEYQLSMVRAGIILYGYLPSEEELYKNVDLIPAMTVKTRVTRINSVPLGTGVSYGHIFSTTDQTTKIATVPIGYADGYTRSLSNKAKMTVKGKTVPVVGRICMDQCMIDVSSVNNISVGDEVIVFGDGRNSSVTADTLAHLSGTISYETLCLLGERLPLVFIKDSVAW